jgi:hypothetical protein
MDTDSIVLPDDPLLDILLEDNNQPSQVRRYTIIVMGICSILFLVLLILSLLFIVTNKQQLWSVTTNASMTTTNTSMTTTNTSMAITNTSMTTTNTSVTTTSTFLASDALKTISKHLFYYVVQMFVMYDLNFFGDIIVFF